MSVIWVHKANWVRTRSPRFKNFFSELRARQHLAPGLWPRSRLPSPSASPSWLLPPAHHLTSLLLPFFPHAGCHSQHPPWTAVHCVSVSYREGTAMSLSDGWMTWVLRGLSPNGRKHQLLSPFPVGRAAFSAVKIHFGLPLDACRGRVMPVYWHPF